MLAVYLQWIQSFSSDLSLHSSILLHLSFRDLISSPLSQRNNSSEMCDTSCIPGTVKTYFSKGHFHFLPPTFMTCMMSVVLGRRSKGKAEKGILGMREARGAFEEALGY